MKKTLIFSLFLLALSQSACDSNAAEQPESLAEKRSLLKEKQESLRALQDEVQALQEAIAAESKEGKTEKLTPVKVQEMQPQKFEHFVQVPGTVSSKRNILLSAKSNGQVINIPVQEGQNVKAGTILMAQESDFIGSQLEEARSAYRLAKTTFERRRRLWADSIGSEIEYLNAENTYKAALSRVSQLETQYDNSFIKAPVAGTVDLIEVTRGQYLGAGTPAVRLVDLANLELEAQLSEDYLQSVQVGDTVELIFASLGLRQKRPIAFVSQFINPDNRSFSIKVKLKNEDRRFKPNLLAEIRLRDYQSNRALVVPSIALKKDLQGDYIYVLEQQDGKTLARKRYVKAGRSSDDRTQILEGLAAGDRVVAAGFNEISDGQEVSPR